MGISGLKPFFTGKRKFTAISIIFIAGLIFLQFLTLVHTEVSTTALNSRQQAVLVRVVDGDTIVVSIKGKNETVRVIGIDTPEVVDPRKTVECFGKEASRRAGQILSANKIVLLEADLTQGDRDKYNRLLRYIWIDNGQDDFGRIMISEGYAFEYTYDTPYKYQQAYKQAENEAREAKKGLWADNACSNQ